ncbi:MAG: hypothetical protein HXO35_00765 [Prevotella sp.]|nr:hypothetical protein [Prevotella sp.]
MNLVGQQHGEAVLAVAYAGKVAVRRQRVVAIQCWKWNFIIIIAVVSAI